MAQKKQATDSVRTNSEVSPGKKNSSTVKPYAEVITGNALTTAGLFTVHRIDDKWYFEIPDSLLGREFLAITRYTRTPGGASFYGGELVNRQSMYWEKGPANKLFLRVSLYINAADSTQAIFRAVKSANLDPIAAAFDILAFHPEKRSTVVEVTDFFKGDNQVVSLTASVKQQYKITSLAADRSFITSIHTYPLNTEIRTVKTFLAPGAPTFGVGSIPAVTVTGAVTVEMNTSLVLLPEMPMRKRFFDARVGYFADVYTMYADSLQKAEECEYIVRWRLEPREEDIEKMRRGELVEPKKPIVYYIDPATPVKWRKYLIAGINDWQKAFEYAGFKNAIMGKEWPENDTTMSMEDARFSVVRYFASPVSNAYGPNIHDPRSGEIIESHIGWFHNVMQLVHDWYMVQAGAVDPRARTMQFDDELMGQLIRFVSSHEIGHTLGLRHNMGASSTTPVEKLRDKAWVEANGHTPSIMDYARFNYVAQPEDSIRPVGIYPRIGVYDNWAIEWGYKPLLNSADEQTDRILLNRLADQRLSADKRLWFGGEAIIGDPRSQTEDLGDDAMKAGEYGIKNLKRVMALLPDWTKEEGDQYKNLKELYEAVQQQYNRYLFHVAKNIGGMYGVYKTVEQKGNVYEPVPGSTLKEAVLWFGKNLFTTPLWLYPDYAVSKLGIRPVDNFSKIQERLLNQIVGPAALLQVNEMANVSSTPYTVKQYLSDMDKEVFGKLTQSTDIYRRSLQKIFVQVLADVLLPPTPQPGPGGFYIMNPTAKNSDVYSIVSADLRGLQARMSKALPLCKDELVRYHLRDLISRIDMVFKPVK